MFVKRIEIKNFRNLKDFEFVPDKEVNIIYGDNAQGKTNLIEALWLFTGSRSFRGTKDTGLIKFDSAQQSAALCCDFFAEGRDQSARITISDKRSATANEVQLNSSQGLCEKFRAVLFTPDDMDIVREGPARRRKFLDDAISVVRPKYHKVLMSYNKAVSERNAILRDAARHGSLLPLLEVYEEHIAKYGEYIVCQRRLYIEALLEHITDIYRGLSGGKENIEISYHSSYERAGDADKEADYIKQNLEKTRAGDMQTGVTSIGPHRDDLDIEIDGVSVRAFGSQGQKRSSVLALILGGAGVLKKHTAEQPIAILDDVMSELDPHRQEFILNHLKGWQVFITCCDPSSVQGLKKGRSFLMEEGALRNE